VAPVDVSLDADVRADAVLVGGGQARHAFLLAD
jgi:hypothetical protein